MIMERNIIEIIKEKLNKFWKIYCEYHQYDPFRKIDPKIFLIGMIFGGFIIGLGVYFAFGFLLNYWDPILLLIIFSVFFIYGFSIPFIFMEMRINDIEKELPDVLFTLATTVRAGGSLEMALRDARDIAKGPIKEELEKTIKEMKEGLTFEEAFQSFGERCRSKIVKRTASIIITAKRSGGGLVDALVSISDDLRDFMRVKRERISKTTMQALFFIAAGIVIAPAIFGLVCSIAEYMGEQTSTFIKPKEDPLLNYIKPIYYLLGMEPPKSLVWVLNPLFKLYLFLLSILCAVGVSILREGKILSSIKYIPIFLLISYVIFNVIYYGMKLFFGGM